MSTNVKRPRLFCDFDGTITRQDVIDVLLETYAQPRWRDVEQEWIDGRISSRDAALGIRIFASHFEFVSGVPKWSFPHAKDCPHGCGTCKPGIIHRLRTPDAVPVVIGDGRSDIFAVDAAYMVYAKGWLQSHCKEQGIPFHPFRSLSDVLAHLSAIYDPAVMRNTV